MTEVMTHAAERPRPRLEARRRAFLDAASTAFLEKGYANTTLDDVIARSGGSRQTLYDQFGGKQGLFEALVADRCDKIFGPLCLESLPERMPDDALLDLGVRYLDTVLDPDVLGLYRVVLAEVVFMKELGERFWRMGPGRTRALLAEYFEQQVHRGVLRLKDPEQAAHEFLGMLLGPYHMQCLLGIRDRLSRDELTRFVKTAVAHFLDGCRAQTGAGERHSGHAGDGPDSPCRDPLRRNVG